MKNRDNRLQVLLSNDERAKLDAEAFRLGLKPSTYARVLILREVNKDKEQSNGK